MQFKGLDRQYEMLKTDIDNSIKNIVKKGRFINGEEVTCLENELKEYIGSKFCVTCANGTDALILALMSLDIRKGDAVFVPDFTFISSASSILLMGATPVFVDVDSMTYNMSIKSLETAIKNIIDEGDLNPRAIITVDLFGQPAEYNNICKLAKENDLLIIEDFAQAFGGEYCEKKAGSFGDISTTSFFPVKPLGGYGDGGAIFTNDDYIASRLKSLKEHGRSEDSKYDNINLGMNSRLDTIQAAILSVKFKALITRELADIRRIAQQYNTLLSDYVKVPVLIDNCKSAWAQYSILVDDCSERNKLKAYLHELNIPSMVYYEKPLHVQKVFGNVKLYTEIKNSLDLSERILSLPIHPYLYKEEVEDICIKIQSFFDKYKLYK